MLGLKLFCDTPRDEAHAILARAYQDGLGIEILMLEYQTKKLQSIDSWRWLVEDTPFAALSDRILHLDNDNTFGAAIDQLAVFESFSREMQAAKALKIGKAVMHYNDRLEAPETNTNVVGDKLKRINALGESSDVVIHLENTCFARGQYANVDYYRQLMSLVHTSDLKHIGFCFDLGHGKALSRTPLKAWLSFLDDLSAEQVSLHFHLHNNGGVKDDHFAFNEAEQRGLNVGDTHTDGRAYLDVISDIMKRYRGMKLLEVPSAKALAQLDWLQARLDKTICP